jgi:hypothetical protein
MAKLSTSERKKLPSEDFALPGKRMFPIDDETHREKALQLAPRALHAGSITEGEEHEVQRKARRGIGSRIAQGKRPVLK